jgi:hypothetical protein
VVSCGNKVHYWLQANLKFLALRERFICCAPMKSILVDCENKFFRWLQTKLEIVGQREKLLLIWLDLTLVALYQCIECGVSSVSVFSLDWINIVQISCRKHFWIVSLIICFPLGSDKVMIVLHCWVSRMWCMLFQHCQQVIQVLCAGYWQEALWSKPECPVKYFCVHEWVTS